MGVIRGVSVHDVDVHPIGVIDALSCRAIRGDDDGSQNDDLRSIRLSIDGLKERHGKQGLQVWKDSQRYGLSFTFNLEASEQSEVPVQHDCGVVGECLSLL